MIEWVFENLTLSNSTFFAFVVVVFLIVHSLQVEKLCNLASRIQELVEKEFSGGPDGYHVSHREDGASCVSASKASDDDKHFFPGPAEE